LGTRLAVDAAWLFAGFLLVAVLSACLIAARRILLDRGGGTVDCGLRRPGGSWRLGVAAYRPDELRWYQAFGVLLTPAEVLDRATLSVLSRRHATASEAASLGDGTVVVECRGANGDGTVELAMSEAALTGFLAWLEAAPPGFYQQGLSGLSGIRPRRPGAGGPARSGWHSRGLRLALSARRPASTARRRPGRWRPGRG
jgi:hypothetical protein